MNNKVYYQFTSILIASLVVSLPVAHADTLNLVYDKNGNLVTGDGFYRIYNSFNQLWKIYNGTNNSGVLLEEYTYDPLEERVLIKNVSLLNGTWKETVYYIFDEYVEVVNSSGTFGFTYIKHEGQLVAELKPDGSKIFYHPDHLGSTTLITNQSGTPIENTSYTPFGEVYEGGNVSRFDYEGKETDDITRQKDFHFRMQGIAGTPPFSQPDSLIKNVYDPQSLNRYAFERGNPIKSKDHTGHFELGTLFLAYSLLEGTLDIISLAISFIDLKSDPGNIDYRLAFELDLLDLSLGPFSNPGPSGLTYKWLNRPSVKQAIIAQSVLNDASDFSSAIEDLSDSEKEVNKDCKDKKNCQKSSEKNLNLDLDNPNKIPNDQNSHNKNQNKDEPRGPGNKGGAIKGGKICVPGSYYVCRRVGKEVICENIGNNC